MKRHLPILLLLSITCSSPTVAANLPAAEDSSSLKGKLTTVTNKATTLPVDGNRRAFVFFDLTELPANAQVRYARLRLYFPTVARAGGGLTLHTVTGQWNEGVASIEPTIEQTPLTTFAPTAVGAKRFVSVDVTDTVKAWLANPASNEGFAIKAVPGATTKLTASVTVGAKEGTGTGYPAELEVELSAVPGLITSEQLASNLTLGGTTSGTFSGNGEAITAVNTTNLTGQITAAQIAPGAVEQAKIANEAVGSAQLGQKVVQAGNVADGAIGSQQLAPNLTLGGITTGTFSGDGAGVMNLNASNLASGTVAGARLAGSYGNALNLPNTGNTMTGAFTASADADIQGNILKNPALGTLLYHASFDTPVTSGNGTWVGKDGFVRVQGLGNQFSSIELKSQQNDVSSAINKPGAFLSAVIKCGGNTPVAGHDFYITMGGGGFTPSGMGFKLVGSALKGFTTELGTNEVDLGTSFVGSSVEGPASQLKLLALRRSDRVEFYVNGVLKGTSITNLPSESSELPIGYAIKATNNSTSATLTVDIGCVTIGYPMF